MKITIKLLLVIFLFVTCSKDETPQIIGKWKLIEKWESPGDSNVNFQRVDYEKTIEFFNDGTLVIIVKGSISCDNGTGISGAYYIEESIVFRDCEGYVFPIQFYFQNSKLILSYPYFEPYMEKYTKIFEFFDQ